MLGTTLRRIGPAVVDCRQAARALRRAPLFFAGLVVTLALGIGANAAAFSLLQAVLFRPLPYERPADLVMIWQAPIKPPVGPPGILQSPSWNWGLTSDNLDKWRPALDEVLTGIAPYVGPGNLEASFDLGLDDRAERLQGTFAAPNFFDVLGVKAARGRVWANGDDASPLPLLVINDSLWRRSFGADPDLIGRAVTLVVGRPRRPVTFTVIGILPPRFRFTYPIETEAWALRTWQDINKFPRGATGLRAVGRVKPGIGAVAAAARVGAATLEPPRPGRSADERELARLQPMSDWVTSTARPSMWLLGGVSILLLLVTCATVSGAIFVRITERQRELAVRASIGADRSRLVRQLVLEGGLLAVAGTVAGSVAALLTMPALRTIIPAAIPRGDEIGVNAWFVAFAATAAAVVTMLSTVAPAFRGARFDLAGALKRGGGASSADRVTVRWRQALLGVQAAMASALLVAAALLLASFWNLVRVPLGFDADRVVTVEMRLLDSKYLPKNGTLLEQFQTDLVERLRSTPGIVDVGLTSAVPFRGVDFMFVLNRTGETKSVAGNARYVDPGYFSVMRVPAVRGRLFTAEDTSGSPKTALISESWARKMFGDENPIGQTIEYQQPVTVVGVVPDLRYQRLDQEPTPAIYLLRSQWPNALICVVARTASKSSDIGAAVRRVVHELDPAIPAMKFATIDQVIRESVSDRRFFAATTGVFAGLGLLLTAIGLSVVVARVVVERKREMAIRAALGAEAPRLIRLAALQGVMPVVAGAVAGLCAAAGGAKVLEQFLFQVEPRAAWIYAAVAGFIVVVAALAAWIPARRVAEASPASLLRAE